MSRFLLIALCAAAVVAGDAVPAPPPLEPFALPEDPTGQSLEAALHFLPEVLATYEDQHITKQEVCDQMGAKLAKALEMGQRFSEAELRKLVRDMVEKLLRNQFMLQAIEEAGLSLPDEALQEAVNKTTSKFGGQANFEKMLETEKMTLAVWQQRLRETLLFDHYISSVIQTIEIEEEQIIDYYGKHQQRYTRTKPQVRASHILVSFQPEMSAEQHKQARDKVESLLARIKQGEELPDLAKTESDCPSSTRGGDLDFFGPQQMVPPFEKAAFALAIGEVSEIVQTQFGYHIIQVTDKREPGLQPMDEVREDILYQVRRRAVQAVLDQRSDAWRSRTNTRILI